MKKLILFILTFCILTTLYAGDVSRKGTSGADQLLIPIGARSIATSGALMSVISGLESIYYNPAGLDLTQRTETMFSFMSYIADINVSYFAAGTNLGDLGSIALSFKSLDVGEIPVTTNQFPDGTGETYSPGFFVAGLTYSKVITDRISVGTNFKLISETIESTSATGFAIDAGVQYRFSPEFTMGAAIKNIGGNMSYSGVGLYDKTDVPDFEPGSPPGTYEIVTQPFQLPSYFELSLAYDYSFNEQNSLLVASTFTANNVLEDEMNFGLEYGFMDRFFVRGGYNYLMENNDDSVFGFTAGAGVNYEFTDGMGLSVDYAFRDVKEFPTPNHIFTVKLWFD